MPFIPSFTAGQNLLLGLNRLVSNLNGIINGFYGENIAKDSIPNDRLMQNGAAQPLCIPLATMAAANVPNLAKVVGLTADGGAVTRKVTGWSFCVGATAATVGLNNNLVVKVGATYGAALTVLTISLNNASLAGGEPIGATTAFDWASGANIYVDYTYGGVAGSYTNGLLVLQVEQPHVAV